MTPDEFVTHLGRERASAILRCRCEESARFAMDAAVRGGFRICEFTLTIPGALRLVAEFAAQGHPIRPGSAGENVSVRGFDWSMVRPGVRVTLGTATVTIAAYAIPCHKNARWFADGDYERMSHQRDSRSRVYARVDVPGRITAGDRAHSLG